MSSKPRQAELFSLKTENSASSETFVLQDSGADVEYLPNAIDLGLATRWYKLLLKTISWQQDTIVVYGKKHLTPRLSCWMGEDWMSYTYSQHTMRPAPWQPLPLAIKDIIEKATGESFNSVLINYYRDGQDSNGWHADDEPELGHHPVIASLSLGAPRDFHMRSKQDKAFKRQFRLEHGSLLMMRGATQEHWQHQIPKRASASGRINLTYRTIVS